MKFLPTIDLFANGVESALRNGQLKLQTGQWIYCGDRQPSRFVALRPGGTLWAVHPQGKEVVSNKRFRGLVNASKPRRITLREEYEIAPAGGERIEPGM